MLHVFENLEKFSNIAEYAAAGANLTISTFTSSSLSIFGLLASIYLYFLANAGAVFHSYQVI